MGTGELRARGRHLVVVVAAIAGAAMWAGSAGGQTVVASEVLQLSSTDEAPEDGALHVGPVTVASAGGPRYRVLLRFDLPPLDPHSLPDADLVLRDMPCYYDDEPSISAYPIVSQWGPDTVWSTQPEVGEPVATDESSTCPDGHVRFDVTGLVREWLTGGIPAFGIELRGDESVEDPRTYATSEGETERLDRRFDPDVEAAIVFAEPQQPPPDSPLVPTARVRHAGGRVRRTGRRRHGHGLPGARHGGHGRGATTRVGHDRRVRRIRRPARGRRRARRGRLRRTTAGSTSRRRSCPGAGFSSARSRSVSTARGGRPAPRSRCSSTRWHRCSRARPRGRRCRPIRIPTLAWPAS